MEASYVIERGKGYKGHSTTCEVVHCVLRATDRGQCGRDGR